MAYAAITYRIRPECVDDIARLFDTFTRVDTPRLRDNAGQPAGRLLGTAVFVKDDVLVRVIHYEGDLADVARHLAAQDGVREFERQLAPYLAQRRDTATPQTFGAYFRDATMRCLSQLTIDTHPAGRS